MTILAEIAAQLPDNNAEQITPAILRGVLNDMVTDYAAVAAAAIGGLAPQNNPTFSGVVTFDGTTAVAFNGSLAGAGTVKFGGVQGYGSSLLLLGGSPANSSLTLQSVIPGVGSTTDYINFVTGNGFSGLEAMRVWNNGYLNVSSTANTAAPDAPLTINQNNGATAAPSPITSPGLHIIGADGVQAGFVVDAFAAQASFTARRAEGTRAAPSAVGAGAVIGATPYVSWNGVSYGNCAQTFVTTLNAHSSTDRSCYYSIKVTASGSVAITEAVRVQASGGMSVGAAAIAADPGAGSFNVSGTITAAYGVATPAGGSTSAKLLLGSTAGFGIYYGSGAPTVSAAQGSIYIRSDGSSTSTRLYVNTNGSTGWTNFVSAT